MQRTLVFLIVLAAGAAVLAARADNSTAIKPNPNTVEIKIFWSDAVEGIQAGVLTEPNQDPSLDRTYQLDLAFHESGLDTSLGLQHVTRAIHFTVTSVSAQITDHKGAPADTEPLADVPTPPGWDLVIPPDGEIHFPIGHGGSSPHQAPGITPKGKLFHLDSGNEWVLLPDRGPYKIAVTLNVTQNPSPDIKGAKPWQGALSLPAVDLPVQ